MASRPRLRLKEAADDGPIRNGYAHKSALRPLSYKCLGPGDGERRIRRILPGQRVARHEMIEEPRHIWRGFFPARKLSFV